MKRVVSIALTLATLAAAGCSMDPGQVPSAVPVTGKVTLGSTPIKNVLVSLQPLDKGSMSSLEVGADGQLSGNVVPGKYAYFISPKEGKTAAERQKYEAAMRAIPEQYRTADLKRTVSISSGSNVEIKLD